VLYWLCCIVGVTDNTLGVLTGYGLVMSVLTIIKGTKNKSLKIIGYVSPLLITVFAFTIIFAVYHFQEFGNLSENYYHRTNMKNVDLSCNIELTENKPSFNIYKTEHLNKDSAYKLVEQLFTNIGTTFHNVRKPELYDDSAYYYSQDSHMLIIHYDSHYYELTKHSEDEQDSTANETKIREVLANNYGIIVPENAGYINLGNGYYTFTASIGDNSRFIGVLRCSYHADGTMSKIVNSISECVLIRECEIINQKDAFDKIERGNFRYGSDIYGELRSLEIISIALDYKLDTKGFYQPVYVFESIINGLSRTNILIPALTK
jgi:hypothetical protein